MAISPPQQLQLVGDIFKAEEQAFHQQKTELLRQYKDQFVAIYQERVVDHASDDEELAKRMFDKFGDVPFYIAKVEIVPTVYELPSPEMVR